MYHHDTGTLYYDNYSRTYHDYGPVYHYHSRAHDNPSAMYDDHQVPMRLSTVVTKKFIPIGL